MPAVPGAAAGRERAAPAVVSAPLVRGLPAAVPADRDHRVPRQHLLPRVQRAPQPRRHPPAAPRLPAPRGQIRGVHAAPLPRCGPRLPLVPGARLRVSAGRGRGPVGDRFWDGSGRVPCSYRGCCCDSSGRGPPSLPNPRPGTACSNGTCCPGWVPAPQAALAPCCAVTNAHFCSCRLLWKALIAGSLCMAGSGPCRGVDRPGVPIYHTRIWP